MLFCQLKKIVSEIDRPNFFTGKERVGCNYEQKGSIIFEEILVN